MVMSEQALATPTYTVWIGGKTRRGSAEQILLRIRDNARSDSKLRDLDIQEYAATLISDAPYFFPDGKVPEFLEARHFASQYDQALEYLAAMPASGVRILSRRAP
jgi:hypothetical protein